MPENDNGLHIATLIERDPIFIDPQKRRLFLQKMKQKGSVGLSRLTDERIERIRDNNTKKILKQVKALFSETETAERWTDRQINDNLDFMNGINLGISLILETLPNNTGGSCTSGCVGEHRGCTQTDCPDYDPSDWWCGSCCGACNLAFYACLVDCIFTKAGLPLVAPH